MILTIFIYPSGSEQELTLKAESYFVILNRLNLEKIMVTKGIIIFYVNVNPEYMKDIKPQELIDITRENNVENIIRYKEEGWDVMFMPTVGESSRCEKVDLIEESNNDN